MNLDFITEEFANEIRKVVNEEYPKLDISHTKVLQEYLVDIVDILCIKMNFKKDKIKIYEKQFLSNKKRDLIGILNILLPFVNEKSDKSNISSLNDIYMEKEKSDVPIDIMKTEPKYKYSNIQYGLVSKIDKKEVQFDLKHLYDNYILLKSTINQVAHKLFVNWINVRPFGGLENEYLKETNKRLLNNNLDFWDVTDETSEMRNYRGITLETIYEVMANDLYYNIKYSKFLIFDLVAKGSDVDNPKPISFIFVFAHLLPIDTCVNNINWLSLSPDERNKFKNAWISFKDHVSNNKEKQINSEIIIEGSKLRKMMISVIRTLNKHISKVDDYDDLMDENLNMEQSELDKEISLIPVNEIYKHFRNQLIKLRETFYGKQCIYYDKNKGYSIRKITKLEDSWYSIAANVDEKLIDRSNKKKGESFAEILKRADFSTPVTLKNIYNYAKSLVHRQISHKFGRKTVSKIYPLPRHWKSLTLADKLMIKDRLNKNDDESILKWFKITGYLSRLLNYGIIDKKTGEKRSREEQENLEIRNLNIADGLHEEIVYFVFEALKFKGVYSEFVPDLELTDETKLPSNYGEKQKYVWNHLKKVVKKFSPDNYSLAPIYFLTGTPYSHMTMKHEDKTYDYFDYITNEKIKHTWQTTYAMDWISQIAFFHKYLNNRVIYVTGSTGVGKSTQIPKLLLYALKAVDYNNNGHVITTQPRIAPTKNNAERIASELGVPILYGNKNYQVQYSHSEGSHKGDAHYKFTVVTDGTLIPDLSNPVMKEKKKNKYTDKNKYDIIIIDEAHEHNTNMDLILSSMKNILYYNNSLKLVIVSATMDEDEPTYRRFYKEINDNRMFPLSMLLHENSKQVKIDRRFVDRRLHISPPGGGTRFKIEEYYYDKPKDLNEATKKVIEIANSTSSGDILYFQPGQGEIVEAVGILNQNTPSYIIALPYFSKMSDGKKTMIENIASEKKKLTITKSTPFYENYDLSNIKTVPPGTYTRVIIVASNMAEASITISSLRYVVDTGTAKVNRYDYRLMSESLRLQDISESSRLQRKGRVGRTAPGIVHYLYPKDAMKDNKTPYNISISNISNNLYGMLQSNRSELIFSSANDPNRITNLELDQLEKIYPTVHRMVEKQYFINNNFFTYDIKQYTPKVYEGGSPSHTLFDGNGTFYIVHPEELSIKRNILGQIVEVDKQVEGIGLIGNYLKSVKLQQFFEILENQLFLLHDGSSYFKTEYGKEVNETMTAMNIYNPVEIIPFIFSNVYNCSNEMIILLSMHMASKNYSNWWIMEVKGGRYRKRIDKGSIYQSEESDSMGFLKMGQGITDFIEKNIFMGNVNLKSIATGILIQNISKIRKAYARGEKIDDKIKQKLDKMVESNKLDKYGLSKESERDNIYNGLVKNDYIKKYYEGLLRKDDDGKQLLKKYCSQLYLNYETVKRFAKKWITLLNKIYKHDPKFMDDDEDEEVKNKENQFKKFKKMLSGFSSGGSLNERITKSFLHAYSGNIVANVQGEPLYVPISNPKPIFAHGIATVGRSPILDSALNKFRAGEYLLFLDKDNRGNMLQLHTITPKIIQETVMFTYSPYRLNKIKLEKGDLINVTTPGLVTKYQITYDNIIRDFTKAHKTARSVWTGLSSLEKFEKYPQTIFRYRGYGNYEDI